MTPEIIYIVTDGEFDGPRPGRNSMLSFASVAISSSGSKLGEFEACLLPLKGATSNPETMRFWETIPDAYRAATENPQDPSAIMNNFVKWVRNLGGSPIFVSHPLALDGIWFDFYLKSFTREQLLEGPWRINRLFKNALCLVSFAAAVLNKSPLEYGTYPKAWLGGEDHTHKAIDDARGYAHLLLHLLSQSKSLNSQNIG